MSEICKLPLRATALAAAMIALAGAGPVLAQAEIMPELRVTLAADDNTFNPTTSSVFQLAQDLGFYDKHKVKVIFIGLDGTPLAAAALRSGAVDVAHITIDAAIRLKAENAFPVRGFAAVSTGIPFLIAARDDIKTMADLVGRSFAVADNGSLDHQLTQAALRSFGIDPSGPNFVAIGAPAVRVQALAVNRIDATTVSFGTYAAVENTPGLHVLLSPDQLALRAPAQPKFLVARDDILKEKRVALQRFTDALIDTAREIETKPDLWIEAATAGRPDLSRESIERTAKFNSTLWCVNGCMRPEMLATSLDFTYSNPDFKDVPVIGVADITDLSFTDKSMETMGVFGGIGMDGRGH